MIVGLATAQSTATVIVAIVGIIGTFLAAVVTQRTERAAERARWIRDRRIDVYLRVTSSYLDALLSITESSATLLKIASIQDDVETIIARVHQLKAESSSATTEADLPGIRAALDRCDHENEILIARIAQLDTEFDIQTTQLNTNYVRFKDQLMPLRVLGSRSVQNLANQVLEEITTLQGKAIKRGQSDLKPLYEKWTQLDNTMRKDLGISD